MVGVTSVEVKKSWTDIDLKLNSKLLVLNTVSKTSKRDPLFKNLSQLQTKIDQLLSKLTLEVIASITGYSFILDALSALSTVLNWYDIVQ